MTFVPHPGPLPAAAIQWQQDPHGWRLDLGPTVHYRIFQPPAPAPAQWLCTAHRLHNFTKVCVWSMNTPAGASLEQAQAACLAHAAANGFILP